MIWLDPATLDQSSAAQSFALTLTSYRPPVGTVRHDDLPEHQLHHALSESLCGSGSRHRHYRYISETRTAKLSRMHNYHMFACALPGTE